MKNWCFWTVVLERTLESPLDCKEIQAVHPKGNRSWIFIGRADVEAETPVLWSPDANNWLIFKDPDPGKDWRWEEKGIIENEMVGWHHQLNEHEFEQTPGHSKGQGSLVCCSPWGYKELDTTQPPNKHSSKCWLCGDSAWKMLRHQWFARLAASMVFSLRFHRFFFLVCQQKTPIFTAHGY